MQQKFETFLELIVTLPWYQKMASLLSGLAIGILSFGLTRLYLGSQTISDQNKSEDFISPPQVGQLTVAVDGSVLHPGVYTLQTGDRLAEAITAAGGLAADANQKVIEQTLNLAEALSDGQKIVIPSVNNQPTATSEAEKTVTNLISINRASLNELTSLTGIGAVRAQSIIDQRPYSSVEDLVSKKVIGESLFAQIKSKISL